MASWGPNKLQGQLAGSLPLLSTDSFHFTLSPAELLWITVLRRTRARTHTHTHTHRVNEYFRDTETTNAHCLGWSHILSEPLHMWACDRQLILVHPHQSKLNRPPGRWRQAIQTHQQGSTNEFSTSSPTRCFSLVLLT